MLAAFSALAMGEAASNETLYTSLNSKDCRELKPPQGEAASDMICSGVKGYALKIHFADAREGLTVIDPAGKEHDLEFTRLIASGFSALGLKAEWRQARDGNARTPVALIVRFWYESEGGKEISSLAISKITPDRICLVEVIGHVAEQNAKARISADKAATMPCLE